jgi:hypothetical protein
MTPMNGGGINRGVSMNATQRALDGQDGWQIQANGKNGVLVVPGGLRPSACALAVVDELQAKKACGPMVRVKGAYRVVLH